MIAGACVRHWLKRLHSELTGVAEDDSDDQFIGAAVGEVLVGETTIAIRGLAIAMGGIKPK